MDWKEYREMPDDGLFEKIERRVRLRRWARVGGVAAAIAVVATAVLLMLPRDKSTVEEPEVVAVVTSTDTILEESQEVQRQSAVQPVVLQQKQVVSKQQISAVDAIPMPAMMQGGGAVQGVHNQEPVLPPATVQAEVVPVTDLIIEDKEPVNTSAATVPAVKSGESTPSTPHYDNVLWAPNIISPMAEEEENRVFKVKSTSTVSDFHLIVYNRGGRQVFSTNDINQGWNATREGSLVPQGAYVWVARFRDSNGSLHQEKGTVTVVR